MSTLAQQLIEENLRTQNPFLDLGNCGLTTLRKLPMLFECVHLETLVLSTLWFDEEKGRLLRSRNKEGKNQLKTIPNDIKRLINLKVLYLSGNKIKNISPLRYLKKLEKLYFWENQVQDILPLQYLTNLKKLYFFDNQVRDVSWLQYLTNLRELYFGENQVQKILSLQYLTNLKELSFIGNQVRDIMPLYNLKNLEKLYINNNNITSQEQVQNIIKLPLLQELTLYANPIKDIPKELVGEDFFPDCLPALREFFVR